MSQLVECQRAFAEAMTEGRPHAVAAMIAPRTSAHRSIALYRRLIRTNYAQVLRITYPVLHRLVGNGNFGMFARGYGRRYPSTSGDLFFYGRHLPLFLLGLEAPRLLVELARLEWACHEVHQAAETPSLTQEQWEALAWTDPSCVTFRLNEAARLLRCAMPVHRVWQALQSDASFDEPVELPLPEEETGILVTRADGKIHVIDLVGPEYRLYEAMADRRTVADIERLAKESAAGFDVAQFMSAVLNAQTRSAFSLEVRP